MKYRLNATALARLWKTLTVSAFCLVGIPSAFGQSFNLYQGAGVLENAWNDWSWCTDDFTSTSYKLSGNQSIEVTFTGGYQGFSLESSNSFPAGDFSALTFYINGGTASNRTINVQLVVNGNTTNAVNLNSYVEGGKVVANLWRRVSLPLSAFNLKSTDQISRFWLQEASGSAQPSFWLDQIKWTAAAAPTITSISVDTTKVGQSLTPLDFGVNTAVWDANLGSNVCRSLIASAGFHAFRFPGGSLSDTYNWQTNQTTDGTTWSTDFDTFASVAAPNKGYNLVTVNYGTGTPALAAAWVKDSNVTKKYGMKYWEVGNEVYGTWETDKHTQPNDPVTYANQFAQYYKQMKAIDATISIGAVASPGEDAFANYAASESVKNPLTGATHSGWTPMMLSTLKSLGVQPDFIIYHRYPEYEIDCDYTLLAGTPSWISDISDLRTQLTDYSGSSGSKTEIFCTETNSDAGPEGKQMVSIVNGLFLADSFGTMLQTECKAMLWWDLINGINTSGDNSSWLYGWREYGDEGIFSPDFTKKYPMFFIEQLLNLFATSGDTVVSASSNYSLLSIFSVKGADGSVKLLVVNKNPSQTLAASVAFAGFSAASTASIYTFGINEDNEARQGKPQSFTSSTLSNVGTTASVSFSPYSVTVLVFKPKSPN